ncbi:MAG: Asp23/Gls24 family envelope stress response protein [Oscillospiraceae bacterium]|nr:Asp23/Gls24 family envelope stress response protein [Oscillospiraceae bacterium]MBQ4544637.1 Asp23/Gls24 family envelope stress response protein [Oscillospiraceae bacterium]MBQ6901742.1 Asp23/Gls24 family envelope stress response protein [Oscillospiraceae bacterium]
MIINNDKGSIEITNDVFTVVAGDAATNCFGVRGMADRSVKDGIVRLLKRENMSKGVKVTFENDKVNIDVHIIVEHGVNITAICESIINEVRYNVERVTRVTVGNVNVKVDSIMAE